MLHEELITIIPVFIVSVIFTAWFIPKILIVSFRKKLFDFEDARKVHVGVVPRLGGVAFVPSIMISIALMIGFNVLFTGNDGMKFFTPVQVSFGICSVLLLYFEGIMDDLVGLGYKAKFLVQNISAALIVLSGVWLNDLYGLFGVGELSPYVGMPLTMLIIVFLINAINLIDGIDGLASGLSIIASFFFGIMFCYVEDWGYAILSFSTFGTLIPFFYYNVFGDEERRRKIFMGDTGSQCIGLILGCLAIRLSMRDSQLATNIDSSIIVAFSMLIVPAFDVIRVMIHRKRLGKGVFSPDKSHIHHKLLALGCPHKMAMVIILMIAMFFVLLNFLLLSRVNINIILLVDVAFYTVMNIFMTKSIVKRNKSLGKE